MKVFNIFLKIIMNRLLNKIIASRIFLKTSLFILLLSITGFICNDILLPWYVNREGVVIVPNVTGKVLNEAKRILDSSKLKIIEAGIKMDDRYPSGTVINQNPVAGKIVKPGRNVYLIISGGEQLVAVPDLIGKSLREVKFLLERHGLLLSENITYRPAEDFPENTIVEQSVEPGNKVKKFTQISVVVSRGKISDNVEVPDLIGKSLKEVEKILGEAGLKIGHIEYQPSTSILPNTIIDQYPRAGDYVSWGEPINLIIVKTGTKKIENFEY